MFYNKLEMPQVIILYGPPLSGKGTQGAFLGDLLPDYLHLDFGTELRAYVSKYNNQQSNMDAHDRAVRLKTDMDAGRAVDTKDLRFVIEQRIIEAIEEGKGLLIEGPGRLLEEAEWLSTFLASKKQSVVIFQLHLTLKEILRRAALRWYVPGINKPFIGYAAAKAFCQNDDSPYQRSEDLDPLINAKRYRTMYKDGFAQILMAYQSNAKALVFVIDAMQPIDTVSGHIMRYLKEFFGFNPNT